MGIMSFFYGSNLLTCRSAGTLSVAGFTLPFLQGDRPLTAEHQLFTCSASANIWIPQMLRSIKTCTRV